MTIPQVPTPAGLLGFKPLIDQLEIREYQLESNRRESEVVKALSQNNSPESLRPIPSSYLMGATCIDPSRLRAFEKAVKQAKPMGSK